MSIQSIAASMVAKRKKMKNGGMVEEDMQDEVRGLPELNAMAKEDEGGIANPSQQDMQRSLAQKLFEMSELEEYAEGGLVVKGPGTAPTGNKPALDWVDDGTEEPMGLEPMKAASLGHAVESSVPMGPALSEEARMAIEAKKKRRRFPV